MTLYREITEAGIETANHESDLYFPVTPESTSILNRYPTSSANATKFKSNIDGKIWYDVPFAYLPWWEARETKA